MWVICASTHLSSPMARNGVPRNSRPSAKGIAQIVLDLFLVRPDVRRAGRQAGRQTEPPLGRTRLASWDVTG